jgi:hypothetical protein
VLRSPMASVPTACSWPNVNQAMPVEVCESNPETQRSCRSQTGECLACGLDPSHALVVIKPFPYENVRLMSAVSRLPQSVNH